jgi:hypothetical protein
MTEASDPRIGHPVRVVDKRSSNVGRAGRVRAVLTDADRPIEVRLAGDRWSHYFRPIDLEWLPLD